MSRKGNFIWRRHKSHASCQRTGSNVLKKSKLKKQPTEVFCKKGVLRNFVKFTGKHQCQSLFLIKLHRPEACNFIKKDNLAQVFSCEFCEISNNTSFTEHFWTTASEADFSKCYKDIQFSLFQFLNVKTAASSTENISMEQFQREYNSTRNYSK